MLQGKATRPAAGAGGRRERLQRSVGLRRRLCPTGQAAVNVPAIANLAGIKGPFKAGIRSRYGESCRSQEVHGAAASQKLRALILIKARVDTGSHQAEMAIDSLQAQRKIRRAGAHGEEQGQADPAQGLAGTAKK